MPDDLPEDVDAPGIGTVADSQVRRHAMIIEVIASPCLIADPRSAAIGSLPALVRREPVHACAPAGCRWSAKRVRKPGRRSAPRSRGIRTSRPWPSRRGPGLVATVCTSTKPSWELADKDSPPPNSASSRSTATATLARVGPTTPTRARDTGRREQAWK
jgi:hypothetical protein